MNEDIKEKLKEYYDEKRKNLEEENEKRLESLYMKNLNQDQRFQVKKKLNILNELSKELGNETIAKVTIAELIDELSLLTDEKNLQALMPLSKLCFTNVDKTLLTNENTFLNIIVFKNNEIFTQSGLLPVKLNEKQADDEYLINHCFPKLLTNSKEVERLYIKDFEEVYCPYNLSHLDIKKDDLMFNAFLNIAIKNNSFNSEIKKYLNQKQKHI